MEDKEACFITCTYFGKEKCPDTWVTNNIISKENVGGRLDVNTPTITIMESTVSDLTVFSGSSLPSYSGFLGVNLRAIIHFNVFHNSGSCSDGHLS